MSTINLFRSLFETQPETFSFVEEGAIKDLLSIDYDNAIIFVNGYQKDKDFILKNDDICTIRILPSESVGNSIGNFFKNPGKSLQNFGNWIKDGWNYTWGRIKEIWSGPDDVDTTNSKDKSLESIPTLSGAKNQSGYNKDIPFALGRSYLTPYYCGTPYHEISANDDGETQYYYALFMIGYEDVLVSDIKLGSVLLASNSSKRTHGIFTNNEIDGRWNPQEYDIQLEIEQGVGVARFDGEMWLYPQKVIEEELGIELIHTSDNSKSLQLKRHSAKYPQKIQVEFALQGLIGYNSSGEEQSKSVTVMLKISFDGGNTYVPFCTGNDGYVRGSEITNNTETGEFTITRKKNKVMRFYAERTLTYSEAIACTNNVAYLYIERTSAKDSDSNTSDSIYLSAIRTWCFDYTESRSHGNLVAQAPIIKAKRNITTRLAIRLKANDIDFKNQLDELNCIVSAYGKIWDGNSWSGFGITSNPASMALRVLEHRSRGKYRYDAKKIDYDSFGEFYEWCEQKRSVIDNTPKFKCDGMLLGAKKTRELIDAILAVGRAKLILNNKKYGVWIDKPRNIPVMVLNNQNILSATNTKAFTDLPDGFNIKFVNNITWQADEIKVMFNQANEHLSGMTMEALELLFQTDAKQIFQNGKYLLACMKLRPETWTRKVSVDGNLLDIGSLIEIQDDTISVGIGDGAEIKQIFEDNNYIIGIQTDGNIYVDDLSKRYGIRITCADGINTPKVMSWEVTISNVGEQSYFAFKDAISTGATYKPNIGDIISFGEFTRETTEALVFGKKDNGDGTFDLTLTPYQEAIYTADSDDISVDNLVFDSKVTDIPQRSAGNYQIDQTSEKIAVTNTKIANIENGTASTIGSPDIVTSLEAKALENGISISWAPVNTNGLRNVIKQYIIEISKDEGETWQALPSVYNSFTTYNFNRASVEDYLEAVDFISWRFRVKAENVYGKMSIDWAIATVDTSEYGTWIPPQPVNILFSANEDGIDATWVCNLNNVYGTIQFEVYTYYDDTLQGVQTVIPKAATYQFNRSIDGFPEKPNTQGMRIGTRTLDKYAVIVRAANITSEKYTDSDKVMCSYTKYKTWIPYTPSISSRISNRNVTLYFSQPENCYGFVQYLVGVRRYDDALDVFYVPDLETNPYSRESAYKLQNEGLFVIGKIESESQFSQTMPLESQSGIRKMLDTDEDETDNRVLSVPVSSSSDDKVLEVALGQFSPIDTAYQFEVYAFNKTVEDFYDSLSVVNHSYNKDTYHKVSVNYARKNVTALATSVQDVLNGSIVSEKVGTGAITETKIEDDAISTPKLRANAVVADKIYTYNLLTLHNGAHAISGYAYSEDLDDDVRDLISRIKAGKESPLTKPLIEQLDDVIKRKSNNYWIGLDTAFPEFYMGNVKVGEKYKEDANYFHYYTEEGETNLDIKLSNFIVTAITSTIKGFFNVRNKKGDIKYTGANSFLQVNPESTNFKEDTVAGYYNEQTGLFYTDSAYTEEIEPDSSVVYIDTTTNKAYRYGAITNTYSEIQGYNDVTAPETVVVKGDVQIAPKNSNGNVGSLTVSGTTALKGGLEVGTNASNKASTLYGSLTVHGDTNISGNTTIGAENNHKAVTIHGSLSVNNVTATGLSSSTLSVNNATTLNSVTASGTSTFNGATTVNNSFTVNNSETVRDNLDVNGNLTVKGSISGSLSNSVLLAMFDVFMPVGFIYVQFPWQASPVDLYQNKGFGSWANITGNYNGAFFRALKDGVSASWGVEQSEGLPNITGEVKIGSRGADESGALKTSGGSDGGDDASSATQRGRLYFNASKSNSIYGASAHVTPANYGIIIWRRYA